MASYDNETYLQSLATARGGIDRQVQNTLSEVGRQRDVAVGQTQKIPGAVQGVTDQAGQMAGGAFDQMKGAITGHRGLNHRLAGTLAQAQEGVQGRLQTVQDAWGQASGLLGQGFDEQATQRRGMVDQIGAQLFADNDLQRIGYIGQREAEDRGYAYGREQQDRQENFAREQAGQNEALARWQMGEQSAEAERNRQWQIEQARAGQLHSALLVNPYTGQPMPAPAQGARSPVSPNQIERRAPAPVPVLNQLAAALGRIR